MPVSTSQSVTSAAGRNMPGQLGFAELAAALPILLWLNVFRQPQDGAAVGAHGEAELGVEPGVEVRQRLGVGLVEGVLEPAPVPRRQPASVDVLVDQRHFVDVLRQSGRVRHRHRLQAIRNLSASCSGSRSP